MTTKPAPREAALAETYANQALDADRRGDAAARDRAILELWGQIGFWHQPGEGAAQKMFRLPRGRSLPWARRWQAVEAWATDF